ncbi:HK97 family phage prohead protease [uncultured Mobiluncus sp.]|uniref:HK97 family phage prohead protease n=1 Tax=uncultured Mobiluncus sp. TaxID=293425 RepID=UPI00262F8B9D|nr:HK97 family phage prohead protease [uncultured Mobiluncus sp.]
METLEIRSIEIRSTSADGERTISGIAVPFNREQKILEGYFETFAPGAIEVPKQGCKLLTEHRNAIGTVEGSDSENGWEIRAKVANTQRGNEALELTRSGVYSGLSIGFEMLSYEDANAEDGLHRTVTRALVREVSLTPFPAYDDATVTNVRQKGKTTVDTKKNETETTPPAPEPPDNVELNELKENIADLERSVNLIQTGKPWLKETANPVDTRSAATLLQSIVKYGNQDDAKMLGELNKRAYSGGTSADNVVLPQWVGDLTRIVDQGAGIRKEFSTGSLPNEGFTLEYAQLKTNTVRVAKQAKEGDALAMGNVAVETKTCDIETFGGATTLSRQEIERGHVRILDHHLRAMAIAAGKRARQSFHEVYESTVTTQAAGEGKIVGKTLANLKYSDWVSMLVDAAQIFEQEGLGLEKLIVDATVFKHLATLTAADGRPLLALNNTGANTVGTMNVAGLQGNLLNIPVKLDTDATAAAAVFANSLAIRSYVSSLVRLQDENILNLTKDFSVYFYGAFAPEMPNALVPVTGLTGTAGA